MHDPSTVSGLPLQWGVAGTGQMGFEGRIGVGSQHACGGRVKGEGWELPATSQEFDGEGTWILFMPLLSHVSVLVLSQEVRDWVLNSNCQNTQEKLLELRRVLTWTENCVLKRGQNVPPPPRTVWIWSKWQILFYVELWEYLLIEVFSTHCLVTK